MEMVPGCLLKIVNLKEDTMREQILEVFEPLGTVQYIDYSKGKPAVSLYFFKCVKFYHFAINNYCSTEAYF